MSSSITLSAATRQNLLSLQGTADLLSTTQNRLSTGKKVNSALDNPVNFFTAQSLDNRSSDLSSLLDGISNGIQTIQAANQGITSIQKLVDSAKSTAQQALATKSTSTGGASATGAVFSATYSLSSALATGSGGTSAAADGTHDFSGANNSVFTVTDATGKQTKVTLDASHFGNTVPDTTKVTASQVLAQINSQLSSAGGNGAQVQASLSTDGRLSFTSTETGSDATVALSVGAGSTVDVGFGITAGTVGTTAYGIDATDGSTKAKATGTALAGAAGPPVVAAGNVAWTDASSDASFTLKLGNGAVKTINLTKAADSTLTNGGTAGAALSGATIVAAINKQINADTGLAGQVTASFNSTTNQIDLHTTVSGSDQSLTVQTTTTNNVNIGFGVSSGGTAAAAVTATGTGSSAASSTSARAALAQQFNDLLTQITQQAQDASYNGVNLLYRTGSDAKENTLHMTFNEKDTSSLDIKGVKFDAQGLGMQTVTGGFASDADINNAIAQLNTASSTLRTQSSTFGSNLTVVQNRQDYTKQMINILGTGSANLTNADMNEEAANSQALSTRNSLGISALSLANQAQQGVLQLLR